MSFVRLLDAWFGLSRCPLGMKVRLNRLFNLLWNWNPLCSMKEGTVMERSHSRTNLFALTDFLDVSSLAMTWSYVSARRLLFSDQMM